MEVLAATIAWIAGYSCRNIPVSDQWLRSVCQLADDGLNPLREKLSPSSRIYLPGTEKYAEATTRWSVFEAPQVDYVVVPNTENDIVETVLFANKNDIPFFASRSAHGAITTLGQMKHGIQIYLDHLSNIEITEDGKSAIIEGGILSKKVVDTLWAAGKQTVTGACECVSVLGPGLGGGHGWLQGHYGLIVDQFISMNIVLANGSLTTIDERSDLWWAMKGAGHNFGIVTSATLKIYDIENRDWAIETMIFGGEKVDAVYETANDVFLKSAQPVDIINWSYWLNIPSIDPQKPVILFWIIQEGVQTVDPAYVKPFEDIGPLSADSSSGSYLDLATWTSISMASPPCQKIGFANTRYPLYLESYNVSAQVKAYELFSSVANTTSIFNNSLFLFEGYSTQSVKSFDERTAAFPFRNDNLLVAPVLIHPPTAAEINHEAERLGKQLRQILHEGSGWTDMHVYVNYAYGDETQQQLYGVDSWRQARLQGLKKKYDPQGKFDFYAPIV